MDYIDSVEVLVPPFNTNKTLGLRCIIEKAPKVKDVYPFLKKLHLESEPFNVLVDFDLDSTLENFKDITSWHRPHDQVFNKYAPYFPEFVFYNPLYSASILDSTYTSSCVINEDVKGNHIVSISPTDSKYKDIVNSITEKIKSDKFPAELREYIDHSEYDIGRHLMAINVKELAFEIAEKLMNTNTRVNTNLFLDGGRFKYAPEGELNLKSIIIKTQHRIAGEELIIYEEDGNCIIDVHISPERTHVALDAVLDNYILNIPDILEGAAKTLEDAQKSNLMNTVDKFLEGTTDIGKLKD